MLIILPSAVFGLVVNVPPTPVDVRAPEKPQVGDYPSIHNYHNNVVSSPAVPVFPVSNTFVADAGSDVVGRSIVHNRLWVRSANDGIAGTSQQS